MLRQLDERCTETDAGRFTVRLVWDSETERTDLILSSGEAPYKVARRYVVPPTRAMDAFRHPFAYAN